MESDGEDLNNIFDEHESRENNEVDRAPENVDDENPAGVKIQPPKRVVKNPRLKFNAERLIGERGIPVLIKHFKDVKFKGKGHEKENLDRLLSKLEHWTHRLFPSMKFEDCLHQIEKLGSKRPVQTCVRKIRLDMPIFITPEFVKDDEEDDVRRNEDATPANAFDQLLGDDIRSNPTAKDVEILDYNPLPSFSPPRRNIPPESRGQVLGSSTSSLTDEQKERLERNKMLAIERRKAKLAALEQKSPAGSSQWDTPDDPFDSLLQKSGGDRHESDSRSGILSEKSASNNFNSDNLGLDDLMDLVDEEAIDTNSVSSATNNNHIDTVLIIKDTEDISIDTNEANNASNLEKSQNCDEINITAENKAEDSSDDVVMAKESLQLESLIDLDNEDEENQPA